MRMSENGIEKLARWEGNVTRNGNHYPYDDATGRESPYGGAVEGFLTIGYGHLLDRSELNSEKLMLSGDVVTYWNGLSEEQARSLLDEDVDWAEGAVNNGVQVPLTQNQFEALVSFTFNVGGNAFRKSTLLRLLNQGQYDEVPEQLMRWTRSGGRVMNGLIKRREHECEHWSSEDSTESKWRFFG